MNGSGWGLRDIVRDDRLPAAGAEFGDDLPDSGTAGEAAPETDDLFVRRHSFLMLFTLIIDPGFWFFVAATESAGVAGVSFEARESSENRLDGASETPLDDLLLCA